MKRKTASRVLLALLAATVFSQELFSQVERTAADRRQSGHEDPLRPGEKPKGVQSPNIEFKNSTEYTRQQDRDANRMLEQIREIRGGPDQAAKVAQILRDILSTDATVEIKDRARRLALYELAEWAEREGHTEQALQFLAEFVERFPLESIVPELLLRQGMLYAKVGAYGMAIAKYYDVMTAAIRIRAENLQYYQRIVLTAQSQIADTQYMRGNFREAAELYGRLLKSENEELVPEIIHLKMIRSLARSDPQMHAEVIRNAIEFLNQYHLSPNQAEIRYLLAMAHKRMGKNDEALRQFLLLLEAVDVADESQAAKWKEWKILAGNEIGNQLYLEGHWNEAIQVYEGLLTLNDSLEWQLPILYQIGLSFERLMSPPKAVAQYALILQKSQNIETVLPPNLKMVVDMARWRHEILSWKINLHQRLAEISAFGTGFFPEMN